MIGHTRPYKSTVLDATEWQDEFMNWVWLETEDDHMREMCGKTFSILAFVNRGCKREKGVKLLRETLVIRNQDQQWTSRVVIMIGIFFEKGKFQENWRSKGRDLEKYFRKKGWDNLEKCMSVCPTLSHSQMTAVVAFNCCFQSWPVHRTIDVIHPIVRPLGCKIMVETLGCLLRP